MRSGLSWSNWWLHVSYFFSMAVRKFIDRQETGFVFCSALAFSLICVCNTVGEHSPIVTKLPIVLFLYIRNAFPASCFLVFSTTSSTISQTFLAQDSSPSIKRSDHFTIPQSLAMSNHSNKLEAVRHRLQPFHGTASKHPSEMPPNTGPMRHNPRKTARMQSPYGRRCPGMRMPVLEENPPDVDDFERAYYKLVVQTKEFPTMLCEKLGCERTNFHHHSRAEVGEEIARSPLSYLMTPLSTMRHARDSQEETSHTPDLRLRTPRSAIFTSRNASSILDPNGSGARDLCHALPQIGSTFEDSQNPTQLRVDGMRKTPRKSRQRYLAKDSHLAGVKALTAHLEACDISEERRVQDGLDQAEKIEADVRRDLAVLAAEGVLPYWYSNLS